MKRYPHIIKLIKVTTTKDPDGNPVEVKTETEVEADVQSKTTSVKNSDGTISLVPAFRIFLKKGIDISEISSIKINDKTHSIIIKTPENQLNTEIICQA
jgi:hypothetical protein